MLKGPTTTPAEFIPFLPLKIDPCTTLSGGFMCWFALPNTFNQLSMLDCANAHGTHDWSCWSFMAEGKRLQEVQERMWQIPKGRYCESTNFLQDRVEFASVLWIRILNCYWQAVTLELFRVLWICYHFFLVAPPETMLSITVVLIRSSYQWAQTKAINLK